ncbi:MAG: hypothetical protein CMI02_17505 [Oceanospirillaceae bacterium]|nr:hypothetical protein [Oceanospirillaceae bacterium]MBT13820.1 hypothetical protein [Oceanospirillaceae bacterium]|tara:strand:+ start:23565 stop:23936 length:372 start_codon:yes stop_codon:yes gene_type:complete
MTAENPNRHLNGVTLEQILNQLVEAFGWETMGELVRINCFRSDPGIKSSLKFLRKTPWARSQVETVYIGFKEGETVGRIRQRLKQQQRPAARQQKKPLPQQNTQQNNKAVPDPWAKAKKNSDQ